MSTLLRIAVLAAWLGFWSGCAPPPAPQKALADAARLAEQGQFRQADHILARALKAHDLSASDRQRLEWQRDLMMRIKHDYSLSASDLNDALGFTIRDFSRAEFNQWMAQNWFDSKMIDGQPRFVGTSVENLFFRHPELEARRMISKKAWIEQKARLAACREIKAAALATGKPIVLPHHFLCTMTVTVKPNVVPSGEPITAWLPIPRAYPYQTDFKLVGSSSPVKFLAPANSSIRSVCLEQPAARGPTKFEVSYSYIRSGVSYDLKPREAQAPDLTRADLAPYVREAPHVIFTDAIKNLARQIVGSETNPIAQAKAFYDWIGRNIQYSYAREYSTLTNISDYCLAHHYGDCGQESLLFITLCRSAGIPARWQSGWDLFPGFHDIHDWSEIYLAPYGWVPVDSWAGLYASQYCPALTPAQRQELHDFYFGGLDYYRMAANSDHSQPLSPPKVAPRSDDVDFQRGELEWDSHNIYFDGYSYNMTVSEQP